MLTILLIWVFLPIIVIAFMFVAMVTLKIISVPFEVAESFKQSKLTNKEFMFGFYVVVALLVIISQTI